MYLRKGSIRKHTPANNRHSQTEKLHGFRSLRSHMAARISCKILPFGSVISSGRINHTAWPREEGSNTVLRASAFFGIIPLPLGNVPAHANTPPLPPFQLRYRKRDVARC